MTRDQLFDELQHITDPKTDFGKILSNLHYTHYYLMDRYKKLLGEYGTTFQQSNVLGIISFYAPDAISLEQVKALVLESNSDVSRIVARLNEKGLIVKVSNPENRRKVSISLTPKGQRLVKQLSDDKRLQEITRSVSRKEALIFVNTLAKLRN